LIGSSDRLGNWKHNQALYGRELDPNVLPGWWYVMCKLPSMEFYNWKWVVMLEEKLRKLLRKRNAVLFEEECIRSSMVIPRPHLHFSNWHRMCSQLMELEVLPLLDGRSFKNQGKTSFTNQASILMEGEEGALIMLRPVWLY
jgi:hypothetical protein